MEMIGRRRNDNIKGHDTDGKLSPNYAAKGISGPPEVNARKFHPQ
jgi:hypothetical protein